MADLIVKKQIFEMVRISCPHFYSCLNANICKYDGYICDLDCSYGQLISKLYKAGYRKVEVLNFDNKKTY